MSDMMNVRRVAELTKIKLSPEEEVRLSAEMEGILGLARQLQQLDVRGIPQTQHILGLTSVLRADEVNPGLDRASALNAAPARTEDYIAVPRTVE